MDLIALVGFIGSGKDTVGRHLVEEHGFYDMAFADALKDTCAAIFCWDREMLDGKNPQSRQWRTEVDQWWAEKLGIPHFTPRWALQNLGTEILRGHLHNDLWLLNMQRRITDLASRTATIPPNGLVITDCRFPNELAMIRQLGGMIVRVRRGPDPDWFNTVAQSTKGGRITHVEGLLPTKDLHISEWAWISEEMDLTIDNNGSIEELHRNTDSLVSLLEPNENLHHLLDQKAI